MRDRNTPRALLVTLACTLLLNQQLLAQTEAALGEPLFSDIDLSLRRNQSRASCHTTASIKVPGEGPAGRSTMVDQAAPSVADPANIIDGSGVSNGSPARRVGTLNAPTAAYAALSPPFHWD